jgi:hypothetical protein
MRRFVLGLATFLLQVAPLLGACPNQCSGHGFCGADNVCAWYVILDGFCASQCSGVLFALTPTKIVNHHRIS